MFIKLIFIFALNNKLFQKEREKIFTIKYKNQNDEKLNHENEQIHTNSVSVFNLVSKFTSLGRE